MDVKYSPEAAQWTDGLKLVEQASTLLAEILGPQSSEVVNAEWKRVQDHKGRPLYRLIIGDFTGNVSTDFTPADLQNPMHLKYRLYRLWGDLLQIRNDQQHQKVLLLSGQFATDSEGN
jgi:hypothetical protein